MEGTCSANSGCSHRQDKLHAFAPSIPVIPLHLSHTDIFGGAAIAAYRLHSGLRRAGVDSHMLVLRKRSSDPAVEEMSGPLVPQMQVRDWGINRLPARVYRHRDRAAVWSVNWFPYTRQFSHLNADLVHLHWIGTNFLPISAWPRLKQPVVWTLHDSWAFTGGCHIPYDCRRYEEHCGRCPILKSQREHDLSWWTWRAKSRALANMRPVIVSPSTWLAGCARSSSLLGSAEIHTIPHGLDLEVFRPSAPEAARAALSLPPDRPLVAFGAMAALTDWNKGADLLIEALNRLDSDADCLIFGSDSAPDGLSRKAYAAGTLSDEQRIAQVYAAADVMVVPSRSENLPLTVMESLACGTPVVAFRIGGIPDLIEHRVNGYLAEPFDTADLARGIAWVLEDPERHARLCAAARAKAEREYEIVHIARRYLALYEDILSRPR